MVSEPTTTTLGEISEDVAYGYTESASEKEVGPRFLRITDIQNGVVNWSTVPFCPISESDHAKYRLHAGDIVVARTGNSTGENYLFRGGADSVFASYLIRFRVDQRRADPAYVWYNLRTKRWWNYVHGSKTGSAQAGANAKVLGKFELQLPPLPEQKAIARILGTLDDKIELNRRMNATLEAMARALFQSWFIDFDPVRRNAARAQNQPSPAAPRLPLPLGEGRGEGLVGYDKLFPASFQASELGEIPEGWSITTLDTIADVGSGKRPVGRSDSLSAECNIPLYGGGGRMGYVSSPLYNKPILFTGRVGTLGIIFRTAEPSWPSDNTLVIEPQDGFFEFTYFALKRFDLITLNRGSTQPLLTQTDLKSQRLVRAPATVLDAYGNFAAHIFKQITANETQSRTLATLRDTLLPKLLSGELSIRNKNIIEETLA